MLTFKEFLLEKTSSDSKNSELSPEHEFIVETIKRDCGPWLKKSNGFLAYRGYEHYLSNGFVKMVPTPEENKGTDDFLIGSVRTDRHPKDSPPWLHDALNEYFKSKTGVPVRSASLFCIGDRSIASNYASNVYCVFPIGDFNYTWSKLVADATDTFYIGPNQGCQLSEAGGDLNIQIDKAFAKYLKENNLEAYDSANDYFESIKCDVRAHSSRSIWAKFAVDFIKSTDLWIFNKGLTEALSPGSEYNQHEIMIVCDKYYLLDITSAYILQDHLLR